MAYPRLLNLSEDVKNRLTAYLNEIIENHVEERGFYVDNLKRWQKDYWVKPSLEVRKFPFHGASNIIVPLVAISVEAVHARVLTTIFSTEPVVSVSTKVGFPLSEGERELENFIGYKLNEIGFDKFVDTYSLEAEKFGTGIAKPSYERIIRKAVRTIGETEIVQPVVVKDGPTLDNVPGASFMMPFETDKASNSPWAGEEHSMTPYEIRIHEDSGMFFEGTFDLLKNYFENVTTSNTNSGESFRQQQEELERKQPTFPKRILPKEIWLSFDIDEDKQEEEIQVMYHYESRTLMAVRHNWRVDVSRPYHHVNYMPIEHRWNGIGIAKQLDQFQREITTIHRQRLDNATLANMRMFKVHKLSGYGPNEPLFPGKMWFLDEMDHVEAFQIGEVYSSAFGNEQAALIYAQQRSGVNEISLGMPQSGTPGTATSDLSRLQEGKLKFDYYMLNLRKSLGNIILDTTLSIKQYGMNDPYFSIAEGGQLALALLNQPVDLIKKQLLFDIGMARQANNRALDRNNWVQISALLEKYYVSMIQMASMTGNQEMVAFILTKGLSAATEAMKQILESYDVRNIDRIIISEVNNAVLQSGNVSGAGGNTGAERTNGANGLDPASQIAGAFAGSQVQ